MVVQTELESKGCLCKCIVAAQLSVGPCVCHFCLLKIIISPRTPSSKELNIVVTMVIALLQATDFQGLRMVGYAAIQQQNNYFQGETDFVYYLNTSELPHMN